MLWKCCHSIFCNLGSVRLRGRSQALPRRRLEGLRMASASPAHAVELPDKIRELCEAGDVIGLETQLRKQGASGASSAASSQAASPQTLALFAGAFEKFHDRNDEDEAWPLLTCCKLGFVSTVQVLLQDPAADLERQTSSGLTAFQTAVAHSRLPVIKLMMADPRIDANSPMDGVTPLLAAIENSDTFTATLLIEAPAIDINKAKEGDFTPLHIAAQLGNVDVVAKLLDRDDLVFSVTDQGATPLHLAAEQGHAAVIRTLMADSRCDVNKAMSRGATALCSACEHGRTEVVDCLLTAPDIDVTAGLDGKISPLHLACHVGAEGAILALLAHPKVAANSRSEDGYAPLFIAAQGGHVPAVRALLAAPGIDTNITTEEGLSPLCIASHNGESEVVSVLLGCEAVDVNHSTCDGATALHLAVGEGHPKVVGQLLAHKDIEVNATLADGTTSLMMAVEDENLEAAGLLVADPRVDVNKGRGGWRGDSGSDEEGGEDDEYLSPLSVACETGNEAMVRLLVGCDRIRLTEGERGCVALNIAEEYGADGVVAILKAALGAQR